MNDEITGATNKLAIFGKTFSQIRLDFKNGYGLKSLFKSPINETDLQQLKNYSFHLLHGTKSTEDFTDALSHCSTSTQLLGKKVLKLKADVDQGKMSKREYANEINNLTTKERTATVATQLLGSALKVAFNVAIGIAISAIVNAIQDYAEAEQKALDKIKDTIDELKNEKDSLNDLKKKYIEIIDSSSDLSKKTEDLVGWKEELSKKYNLEADALDKVNEKRETGIALLEAEIQKTRERWYIDNKEDIEKYVDMLEARRQYTGANGDNPSAVNSRLNTIEISLTGDEKIEDLVRSDFLDLLGQVKQDLRHNERYTLSFDDVLNPSTTYEYYHKLEDILNKASEIGVANLTEQEQALVERAKAAQKNIIEQFKTFYHLEDDGVKTMFNTYDTYLEYLLGGQARDIINDYISQQGKSLSDVNSDNFVSWREELADLAKEDEKLKAILLEYANTTFPSFYKAEQQAVIAASNEEQSVTSLVEALTNLGSAYDDAQKNHAVIQSAFDKVREGTSLTADEVNKLITLCQNDFPLIGRLFTKTADGYTIAAEDLIEANDAIMQSTKDTLNAQIEQLQKTVDINTELAHKLFDENNYVGMAEAQGLAQEAYDQIQVLKLLLEMLDLVYTPKKSSGSSNDATKEAFEKDMKDIEHLHNMGLKSDKEYYDALEKANEKHYKNSVDHESDYLSNIEKIYNARRSLYKDDADKQFDDLEDQRKRGIITAEQYAQGLHDLGQELYGEGSIYGGTEFAIKALEELDKKVKETPEDIYNESLNSLKKNNDGTLKSEEQFIKDWTKLNDDTWKATNPKQWEDNYNEIADYTQDFYKDLLDKGVLNPDQYKDKVQSFFYRLKSMGIDLGKNWLADALEIDDIEYDKLKESLSADGDRTLDDVLADAEKLSEKNIKLFSDDPETLRKNAEDIFKSVSESAKDALDKMLITPDEYLQIINKWGDNLNISKGLLEEAKELSEDDYLERWDLDNGYDENKSKDDYELRAKRIEYIYGLAEQLYGKNGQKNLKAYNALINQGLEDVESLVEDYYDAEIKKLEEINDEEEKRQKALELQLNLIKARKKLEEAKNNRNQLVFHNGTFEYMSNQDDVLSAQEDYDEAKKAILEQEREDQKEVLEKQKEETLKFFSSVGGKLDNFIDRVQKFLAGDKDAFKVDTEGQADTKTDSDVTVKADSVEVKDTTDSGVNIQTDASTEGTDTTETTDMSNIATAVVDVANPLLAFINSFGNGSAFENLVRALGGNPTAEAVQNFKDSYNATLVGKQITPSTVDKVVNNSSNTTNNNNRAINVGDININLQLTLESLKEFVNGEIDNALIEVGNAFKQKLPVILAKA